MQETSFRRVLQKELISRCRANPRYSLRAFARNLGIAPSSLSLLMNGSRPITPKMRERLGLALGLKPGEFEHFEIGAATSNYQHIDLATFEVISEWYHFAILELIQLEDFKPEFRWIANALNITTQHVAQAVENLTNIGILKITGDGHWIDTTPDGFASSISPGATSEAARRMQEQLLDLSKTRLQETHIEKRDHSAITVAIDSDKIDAVKEKIKKFRRELAEFLSDDAPKDEVYQIAISFFPSTNLDRSRKS